MKRPTPCPQPSVLHKVRKSKVGNPNLRPVLVLRRIIRKQDILEFQVAVDNVAVVEVYEGGKEGAEDGFGEGFGEGGEGSHSGQELSSNERSEERGARCRVAQRKRIRSIKQQHGARIARQMNREARNNPASKSSRGFECRFRFANDPDPFRAEFRSEIQFDADYYPDLVQIRLPTESEGRFQNRIWFKSRRVPECSEMPFQKARQKSNPSELNKFDSVEFRIPRRVEGCVGAKSNPRIPKSKCPRQIAAERKARIQGVPKESHKSSQVPMIRSNAQNRRVTVQYETNIFRHSREFRDDQDEKGFGRVIHRAKEPKAGAKRSDPLDPKPRIRSQVRGWDNDIIRHPNQNGVRKESGEFRFGAA